MILQAKKVIYKIDYYIDNKIYMKKIFKKGRRKLLKQRSLKFYKS